MLAAVADCDFVWSSKAVCDCGFRPAGEVHEWQLLDKAPANYGQTKVRRLFDNDDPVFGTPDIFDSADIHWYRSESGEAAACIVFESSKRMNAVLYLPADQSAAAPIDFRILGIPFGRERYFWEGCGDFGARESERANRVLVDKSDGKLYLLKDELVITEYSVVFGANPKGHKEREGDERTPEGHYVLDNKYASSAFYKAIHISYPNELDKQAAAAKGVDPGGAIMIHGQPNGLGWISFLTQRFNWTDGCIAVTNDEMDEIWRSVTDDMPIEIRE